MSDRVIQTADISRIESNLSAIVHRIGAVDSRVRDVEETLAQTHRELMGLIDEFQAFVAADIKAKNVQLAETRLVKVRQEIETKYGHYADVRRLTTGILQAVDTGLVQHETIRTVSEEQMLLTPRYWLAPAVIALAAWVQGNRALADRALTEGLRRDSMKTCLFLALVTRRGGRYQSARTWLDRYFSQVDPNNVNREMIVLLDAYVGGTFGPDADGAIAKRIQGWLDELAQKVGFVESQQERWVTALEAKAITLDEQSFPYLREYSPTWPTLAAVLSGARLHHVLHEYFDSIFTGPATTPQNIAVAVDDLLDKLVTGFDEEELPLRREERLLSLIVETDGDKAAAQARADKERSTLDQQVDLSQRFTDWAMHPKTSNASRASQRFAIAVSRNWILSAHDEITMKNRAAVPLEVQLKIEQWTGTTRDGSNEAELLTSVDQHVEAAKTAELAKVRLFWYHWFAIALGVASLVTGPLGFVILAGVCLWVFVTWLNLGKRKAKLIAHFEQMHEAYTQRVRALCAEVVDWRRLYTEEDAKAEGIREFLGQINPEQCIATGREIGPAPETSRAVEEGVAAKYPDWDLQPALQIVRRKASV